MSANGSISVPPKRRPYYRPKPPPFRISLESVPPGEVEKTLKSLRQRDTNVIKRIFPDYNLVDDNTYTFRFKPSDPEWPFDVAEIGFQLHFPLDYPLQPCSIVTHQLPKLPNASTKRLHSSLNLPIPLSGHINKCIEGWISDRFKKNEESRCAEMVMRPFWKWFDKNVQKFFVEGLRLTKLCLEAEASGISAVVPKTTNPDTQIPLKTVPEIPEISPENLVDIRQLKLTDYENTRDQQIANGPIINDEVNNLTSIKSGPLIRINVELGQNVALLQWSDVSLVCKCSRCKRNGCWKSKCDFPQHCQQCGVVFGANFRSCMVHNQCTNVGNLEGASFQPVDMILPESTLNITCLKCDSQIQTTGVTFGSLYKTWCNSCHALLTLLINWIRFPANCEGGPSESVKIVKREKGCEPVLVQGKALPKQGTCAHYKKSFRWFRFPCCGKLYACDLCHELESDHEMKFANRVVCGWCSTEQPWSSSKPCNSCNGAFTKNRTSHWEGGKGCRSKKIMSRGENRKYTGLNKTISRQKQKSEDNKK